MSKIVIIGANHAGTAAINTILDHYPGNEVVVFDANDNISFLGCGMALWIGKQIRGPEGLFYATREAFEKKGAVIHMETPVDRVDFPMKTVYATDKNGKKYVEHYDKLIFATGSLPVLPDIPGRDLTNVQQVKLYQNAADVIDKLADETVRAVAVVGAGYIGVELAEAFRRCGKEVTLLDVAPTCLAAYYDEPFSQAMAARLSEHGVTLAFGRKVERLEGDGRVRRIVTDGGEYAADMVILAVGFRPNTALGHDALSLFRNGAYLVDRRQRTSEPDVFAIGDCATVLNNVTGDTDYIALATNAVRSGILAAHNACGTELETTGVQGSNGISIWGLNMVSTGASLEKAKKLGFDAVATDFEDLQKPPFIETNNPRVQVRIVYDRASRRILGAQMASDHDISMGIHMFSLAIQEKLTIDKLALLDLFFLPHFNQPYNYITMAALSAL